MAKSYPSLVTTEWLKKYMTNLHFGGVHPSELADMDTGWDDPSLIGNFKLIRVPLNKLVNRTPQGTDEMLADDYAEMSTALPPIVLDSTYEILDGNHRAMAASIRGDKDIAAYVPVVGGKKVGFISIPLGRIQSPTTKVAISVPELVAQTNAFSVKRRPGCNPTLLKSNPKQLELHYNVKCPESYSDPAGHDVRVKFDVSKVEDTQNANDLDVQLNCSCPAFLYWGAQWNLHQRDGLLGDPRPELRAPTERLDLRKNFVICKHCKAVLERILPSVQHNIINIIREKTVEKNKLKMKEDQTSEKLNKKQEDMKKRQELKKIRETKNKDVQKKLLDALRVREEEEEGLKKKKKDEEELLPEEVGRTEPAVVDTPILEDVTEYEEDGEDDLTGMVEKEEHKLQQKQHEHIENEPHLHTGLPYETEEQKQEHGHKIPTDKDLIETLSGTKKNVDDVTKSMKDLMDSGQLKKFLQQKRKSSLEAKLLASIGDD
jgi:hypothetical protein